MFSGNQLPERSNRCSGQRSVLSCLSRFDPDAWIEGIDFGEKVMNVGAFPETTVLVIDPELNDQL